ncbi:MAG: UDP-2,3-diacylglucosamine diphosphatase [Chitinophagaceae bacterium]
MRLTAGKKIYFLSDFHLGAPDQASSLIREKRIVKFLDKIKTDAAQIFILGDISDFWFEYKRVVPKGFVRILGKLAELTDSGIEMHFFVGNHDMWMKGYFEKELNIKVYYHPAEFDLDGKKIFIGHGDGLGPKDHRYKFMKKVFRNKFSQRLFGFLHPGFGIGLANYFSGRSREATGKTDEHFLGEEKEWLIIFSREKMKTKHYDYFIFGHRHLPIDFKLSDATRYINLGDWIKYNSYAVFNGENVQLKFYTE